MENYKKLEKIIENYDKYSKDELLYDLARLYRDMYAEYIQKLREKNKGK